MQPNRAKVLPPLVLIVDNDPDTCDMYSEMLVFSGVRVVASSAAQDAMEKAQTLQPDVITTDLGLWGTDGCRLCEDLKNDARTSSIPIIAVTGWAESGHVERAKRAGCDSVLVKPCAPDALLAEIYRILKSRADTGG